MKRDQERYPCPRCGSDEAFCLPLTDKHPHATVLRMHPERGMSAHDLERAGYVAYEADVDGAQRRLWRKPGAARCTRGASVPVRPVSTGHGR